jgi:hypothetical protein
MENAEAFGGYDASRSLAGAYSGASPSCGAPARWHVVRAVCAADPLIPAEGGFSMYDLSEQGEAKSAPRVQQMSQAQRYEYIKVPRRTCHPACVLDRPCQRRSATTARSTHGRSTAPSAARVTAQVRAARRGGTAESGGEGIIKYLGTAIALVLVLNIAKGSVCAQRCVLTRALTRARGRAGAGHARAVRRGAAGAQPGRQRDRSGGLVRSVAGQHGRNGRVCRCDAAGLGEGAAQRCAAQAKSERCARGAAGFVLLWLLRGQEGRVRPRRADRGGPVLRVRPNPHRALCRRRC